MPFVMAPNAKNKSRPSGSIKNVMPQFVGKHLLMQDSGPRRKVRAGLPSPPCGHSCAAVQRECLGQTKLMGMVRLVAGHRRQPEDKTRIGCVLVPRAQWSFE